MTEATCVVLAAVYPLVLITVVLEQRAIHLNIRRHGWFRKLRFTIVGASMVGLILSIVGVQFHGMGWDSAWANWGAGAVSIVGLAVLVLAVLATTEDAEDAAMAGSGG